MRFGDTLLPETFNLLIDLLGELHIDAARLHSGNELFAKRLQSAFALPGRHGAAQLIGLAGREARRDHGELHYLLLKNRYAQRALQHLTDVVVVISYRL